MPDGSCIVETDRQCRTQGGVYQGDRATCDDATCPVFGACCIPFDICETTTIQVCFGDLGGVIWAPEQACGDFTCPPLGACCEPDGMCRITRQSSCENTFGGTYQGDGVACEDVTCTPRCLADIDGDGVVAFSDLPAVLSNWGPCAGCPQDIDGDRVVGFSDLLGVLSAWGPCT